MAKFTINLGEYAKRTGAKLETLAREIVFEIPARIVMRSPVGDPTIWTPPEAPPGYVGGRFRANWQHGFGSYSQSEIDGVDPGGQQTLTAIRASVEAAPASGIHYIVNNLPYAVALENGYSTQAPKGMVALTVVEFEGIVRDEIARMA